MADQNITATTRTVTIELTPEEVEAVLDNWLIFATRRQSLNSGSGLARTCAKVARALDNGSYSTQEKD